MHLGYAAASLRSLTRAAMPNALTSRAMTMQIQVSDWSRKRNNETIVGEWG